MKQDSNATSYMYIKDQYINLAVLWSKSVVSVKEILRWKEKENIYFFISHHLIENYFFLAMIWLKNCSVDIQQQSLTKFVRKCKIG
jgi:hypothetical protein